MLYSWYSAMHTRVDIVLLSPLGRQRMMDLQEEVRRRIVAIESIGNCFAPDSELSLFNAGRLGREQLCAELRDILDRCDRWRTLTDGLFDVAVEGRTNLSGFLKGYALDQVLPIIRRHGIADALVNLGNSSVMALGSQHADSGGWTVENTAGERFTLCDECLTTSGNNMAEHRHIINPLTNEYVVGQRIVSVVTKTGEEGEVRSTVAMLLAGEKG